MSTRIEFAEVISFRLKIPSAALARLVEQAKPELSLSLLPAGDELLLSVADGDSFLRFRPAGPDAILTEIAVCNDARGLFFHRVLAALMREHGGDLHVRLVWTDSDGKNGAEFVEFVVQAGRTPPPELSPPADALRNTLVASSLPAEAGPSGSQAAAEAHAPPPLPSEDLRIEQLLSQARADWAEYQRLKSARESR